MGERSKSLHGGIALQIVVAHGMVRGLLLEFPSQENRTQPALIVPPLKAQWGEQCLALQVRRSVEAEGLDWQLLATALLRFSERSHTSFQRLSSIVFYAMDVQ